MISDCTDWFIGTENLLPNKTFPIVFNSLKNKSVDSPGFYNSDEVKAIVDFMKTLLTNKWNDRQVNLSDIGVISPYKDQCTALKNEFRVNNWETVEIGSVESFQGKEKSIIIVSTVRSSGKLGFLKDEKV